MQLAIYAHPFDLDALRGNGGLARLRDLGFAEVAMATSYHDGRWLTPWHPSGRVRFLEDGTVHFRTSSDHGVLQPKPSSEVPASGPSPLERLCAEAAPLGVAVRAWNVFTHNSRLGALHPDQCVQNAFGDRYTYALCPSQPAVRQYATAMAGDLAAHHGLGTIELEALGQMGWKHSSHHDKASFAPSGMLDAALSACFCDACAGAMGAAGHDPARLRVLVRTFVDRHLAEGDAMAPANVAAGPGDAAVDADAAAWLDAATAVRAGAIRGIADSLRAQARVRLAVQVHPHPWFTGSQLAIASAAAFAPSVERVVTCYGDGVDAISRTLAAMPMSFRTGASRVCIWPKAPQFRGDEDLVKLRDVLRASGTSALAVYHLGLLPWRTIERVAKVFGA
ncbi:MAG: hypothetical protein JNK78_18285 [Planctomycetes bacterium]|nr:hypothetical protein [Planctomycetota bacterium]